MTGPKTEPAPEQTPETKAPETKPQKTKAAKPPWKERLGFGQAKKKAVDEVIRLTQKMDSEPSEGLKAFLKKMHRMIHRIRPDNKMEVM
jgi:hypothetical protein